jgi:hypothetical protein
METEIIELLNGIAGKVPEDYFRDDGTKPKYFAYAWFHGATCIYVGEGTGNRWQNFFTDPNYNDAKTAHPYIRAHHKDLRPFFVNSVITKTAGRAIEATLQQFFKLRKDGGTLFNRKYNNMPARPSADRRQLREGRGCTAEPIAMSSRLESLSRTPHWRDVNTIPDFPLDARLRLLKNVWDGNVRKGPNGEDSAGLNLYREVLVGSATVGEAIEGAREKKMKGARTPRQVQNHLKWAFVKDGVEIDGKTWSEVKLVAE